MKVLRVDVVVDDDLAVHRRMCRDVGDVPDHPVSTIVRPVALAHFSTAARFQIRPPAYDGKLTHTGTLRRPSGAVSGGSTVLSGFFRRRTSVSEDLCL
jgi:hypothetical protein